MCGIVGYIGNKQAQPILINALVHLEYRGYDSSGIAVKGDSIQVYKDKIRVNELKKTAPLFSGNSGIGHTRWATHGEPSQSNAHPHTDCAGQIAIVHNGVISNYQKLKDMLILEGHNFTSETDTEVISHLIEKYYHGDIEESVKIALDKLEGSYAIVVLSAGDSKLIAAKNGNPLIIGVGEKEKIIASDIPALLDYTNRIIYLEDGDIATITQDDLKISNGDRIVERPETQISWNSEDVQKDGYEHYMLKEIHEEPKTIKNTIQELANYCNSDPREDLQIIGQSHPLLILACGTSYHASLVGKYIIEDLLDVQVHTELASEVNHRDHVIFFNDVLAITQSGETADVLYAMRQLRKKGSHITVITNVHGSSASLLANKTIYTAAGPEMSVAATKSFVAQLTALYSAVLSHPKLSAANRDRLASELKLLPGQVQQLLDNGSDIESCAKFLSGYSNAFFIGRGINHPIAMEGALKLKEISYIHAEGYAAGELKHGPFSLLQPDTPVIGVVAQDKTYSSMIINIKEVKSRKSPVIAIINENDNEVEKLVDKVIRVPHTSNLLSPVVNAVALQLLAYYTARFRGCPIDFPRNLAKSVTVE
jgi:glutamine---fructose-6-phosphate transaminase (isomerizing)